MIDCDVVFVALGVGSADWLTELEEDELRLAEGVEMGLPVPL